MALKMKNLVKKVANCNTEMNHQRVANKKTYLFATSSNEMAFPNKSMPPTSANINRRNEALNNDDTWYVMERNYFLCFLLKLLKVFFKLN